MSQLDDDIKSAVQKLAGVGITLTREALAYSDHADRLMRKAEVVITCAELPGDMPLRVCLQPNVFNLKA